MKKILFCCQCSWFRPKNIDRRSFISSNFEKLLIYLRIKWMVCMVLIWNSKPIFDTVQNVILFPIWFYMKKKVVIQNELPIITKVMLSSYLFHLKRQTSLNYVYFIMFYNCIGYSISFWDRGMAINGSLAS